VKTRNAFAPLFYIIFENAYRKNAILTKEGFDNEIEKMLKDAGEIVYLSKLKLTNEMFSEAVNTGNTLIRRRPY
jgi:hypothetical protein